MTINEALDHIINLNSQLVEVCTRGGGQINITFNHSKAINTLLSERRCHLDALRKVVDDHKPEYTALDTAVEKCRACLDDAGEH